MSCKVLSSSSSWHLSEVTILKSCTKIMFCTRMPKSLRQYGGFAWITQIHAFFFTFLGPYRHSSKPSETMEQGRTSSSQWEDIQVSGGNWGNDSLMSSALSNFFKSMIQRIGLPWTFQTSEASQGHECRDIPGEKTMEDKMEMRNGLFRSLDPRQGVKRIWRKRWKCLFPAGKEIMT